MCETMWGIRCVGVSVGARQRISLSVLERNPHNRPTRKISHKDWKDKMRKVPEIRGMRGESRKGQSAEG